MCDGLTMEDECGGLEEGRGDFVGTGVEDGSVVGFDRMEDLRLVGGNVLCGRDFLTIRRLTRDRLNDISDSSFIGDSISVDAEVPF